MTVEDLKKAHLSQPRHILLADVFYKAGFIESWGSGTLKIAAICRAHHLQEPEFEQQSNYFSITFFSNAIENEPENERYKMIIYEIRKNKSINIDQLATKIQVNRSTIKRDLAILKDKGVIIRTGPAKGGYWQILKK